ncbi:hypothetical protein BH09BAC6_BH09BAC6_21820 [soil metagenome]
MRLLKIYLNSITMSKDQPVKPETTDPIKESMNHPDGPSLTEMIYGKEEHDAAPIQNDSETANDKPGKSDLDKE